MESRFSSFADEGHWVLGRENSLRWHQAVVGWCDSFCGVEGGKEGRKEGGQIAVVGRGQVEMEGIGQAEEWRSVWANKMTV